MNANNRFVQKQSKRWMDSRIQIIQYIIDWAIAQPYTRLLLTTRNIKYQSKNIVYTVCSLWSTSSNCKQTIAPMIALQPSFRASLNVVCCIIDRSLPARLCRSVGVTALPYKMRIFQRWFLLSIEIRTVAAFKLPFERGKKKQSKLGIIESGFWSVHFVEIQPWVLLF